MILESVLLPWRLHGTGPLAGLKVIELVGLGPGPFAGMLLADMGADVLRIDRVDAARAVDRSQPATSAMNRGKWSLAVDLKHPKGVATLLRLVDDADALFEVFRPGVAERLGIGPDVCLAAQPAPHVRPPHRLGQDGPYAHTAGHDIDYLALAGASSRWAAPATADAADQRARRLRGRRHAARRSAWRAPPSNGPRRARDKSSTRPWSTAPRSMLTPFYAGRASGFWGPRGTNFLDTGAPFYEAYETADGGWIAVGAIEPQFYAELRARLGLADDAALTRNGTRSSGPRKRRAWPRSSDEDRAEWCELLEHTDACFAPALAPTEAPDHPHNRARHTFLRINDVPQPAPAPGSVARRRRSRGRLRTRATTTRRRSSHGGSPRTRSASCAPPTRSHEPARRRGDGRVSA